MLDMICQNFIFRHNFIGGIFMKEWFNKIPVEDMISWRHHIHQNPEVSFKEYKTAEFVEEKLRSFGNIEIKRQQKLVFLVFYVALKKERLYFFVQIWMRYLCKRNQDFLLNQQLKV